MLQHESMLCLLYALLSGEVPRWCALVCCSIVVYAAHGAACCRDKVYLYVRM